MRRCVLSDPGSSGALHADLSSRDLLSLKKLRSLRPVHFSEPAEEGPCEANRKSSQLSLRP